MIPTARHAAFARLSVSFLIAALASCGGSGYNSSSNMGPPLTPTITMSIAPTTITVGQSATLTWSTTNASSCTASGGWSGTEATGGTQKITPKASGSLTYTLTCTAPSGGGYAGGGGGKSSMSASLAVNAASAFALTKLVADTSAAGAMTTDPNLVNPWGVAFGTGPVWVANNHSETSTLYDGAGVPQPSGAALVVNLAPGTGGVTFDPTGVIFNSTTDFVVTEGANSGAALFIFAGEGGMIAGWALNVDLTNAINVYADANGAVYKAVALANSGTANFLYAADFHNNKVDVFDATFAKQASTATSFTFTDPSLPPGYAPFGIQAIKNGTGGAYQIYVAYAVQQGPDNHDNANGAGLGLIDIYDTNGKFVKRLASPGDALNAPWGMAVAPSDFGTLSGALLVGNFGDGTINGYDASSGVFMGAVTDHSGVPIALPGLWGIAFGNDANSQPHNTLFFAAGPNDEANGLYGRIDLGPAPTLSSVH